MGTIVGIVIQIPLISKFVSKSSKEYFIAEMTAKSLPNVKFVLKLNKKGIRNGKQGAGRVS